LGADDCGSYSARILPRARKEIQLYSQRQNDAIQIAAIIAAIITMVFLCVLWPLTAGAQVAPTPTPVCTLTPDGEQCTSSVAMTGTPTATQVVPPPTPTPVTLSPLPACVVKECVWMPIARIP